MSYIENSLGDGETIIARAQFPWLYVTAAWLCLLVPLVLVLAAYSQAQTPARSLHHWRGRSG